MPSELTINTHHKIHEANNALWDIIRDIHENEISCLADIKQRLIGISGILCADILYKIEIKYPELKISEAE